MDNQGLMVRRAYPVFLERWDVLEHLDHQARMAFQASQVSKENRAFLVNVERLATTDFLDFRA